MICHVNAHHNGRGPPREALGVPLPRGGEQPRIAVRCSCARSYINSLTHCSLRTIVHDGTLGTPRAASPT